MLIRLNMFECHIYLCRKLLYSMLYVSIIRSRASFQWYKVTCFMALLNLKFSLYFRVCCRTRLYQSFAEDIFYSFFYFKGSVSPHWFGLSEFEFEFEFESICLFISCRIARVITLHTNSHGKQVSVWSISIKSLQFQNKIKGDRKRILKTHPSDTSVRPNW